MSDEATAAGEELIAAVIGALGAPHDQVFFTLQLVNGGTVTGMGIRFRKYTFELRGNGGVHVAVALHCIATARGSVGAPRQSGLSA